MSHLAEDFKQDLLRLVSAVVPVSRALFYEVDHDLEPRRHIVLGGDTHWIGAYERYRAGDPFHPRHFQARPGSVFGDGDVAVDCRAKSTYVTEFRQRVGVRHKAEIFIRDPGRRIVAGVRLGRDASSGAFEPDSLARLRLLEPVLSRACLAAWPEAPTFERFQLTLREQQVLEGLLDGLPDKLIARRLQVALPTVKLHARTLYRKLGVRGRAEAVALAYRCRT